MSRDTVGLAGRPTTLLKPAIRFGDVCADTSGIVGCMETTVTGSGEFGDPGAREWSGAVSVSVSVGIVSTWHNFEEPTLSGATDPEATGLAFLYFAGDDGSPDKRPGPSRGPVGAGLTSELLLDGGARRLGFSLMDLL